MPGDREGGEAHEGGGWVQRETHGFGKVSGRGAQNKNKEITKSDPISYENQRRGFQDLVGDNPGPLT